MLYCPEPERDASKSILRRECKSRFACGCLRGKRPGASRARMFKGGIGSASPAKAVTGNFVPDNTHNYVALVAFYDADGNFFLGGWEAVRSGNGCRRSPHGLPE